MEVQEGYDDYRQRPASQTEFTAYDLMGTILDINEAIEANKIKMGAEYDAELCKTNKVLAKTREIIISLMKEHVIVMGVRF